MTQNKFATLTAGLLARKGEAHPATGAHEVGQAADDIENATENDGFSPALQSQVEEIEERWSRTPKIKMTASNGEGRQGATHVTAQSHQSTNGHDEKLFGTDQRHVDVAFGRRTAGAEMQPNPSMAPKQEIVLPDHPVIKTRALAPSRRRTAVTVRMDETQYLRLKYAGAVLHKTNHQILSHALDLYLRALGPDFMHDNKWLREGVKMQNIGRPRRTGSRIEGAS
jgi:hypothetical protein